MLLKKCLKDTMGLEVNLRKKGNAYDIAVPTFHSQLFEGLVEPYILPSFQYKIGR
jgi:hypothetical protein